MIYHNLNEIYNDLEDFSYKSQLLKRASKKFNSNHDINDIVEPAGEDDNEVDKVAKIPRNGEIFEEDIIMDARLSRAVRGDFLNKKSVIVVEDLKWEGGVLPYVIHKSFSKIINNFEI